MKKKTIANIVMVAAIALIAAACVIFALSSRRGEDPLVDAYLSEHESSAGTELPEDSSPKKVILKKDRATEIAERVTEPDETVYSPETEEKSVAETFSGDVLTDLPATENAPAADTFRETERGIPQTEANSAPPAATERAETEKVTEAGTETAEEELVTCTVTIRCDTILSNMADLDRAKEPYVPQSGCILSATEVEIDEGDTVFDVLRRVSEEFGIQLEYNWTPIYDSYYVEGIAHLYEFDCGEESGWMYRVDGSFANYGCSSYKLTGGEYIEWVYTCRGLGADVGAPAW